MPYIQVLDVTYLYMYLLVSAQAHIPKGDIIMAYLAIIHNIGSASDDKHEFNR